MSGEDDPQSWFSEAGSSDSADERDPGPRERRLESVPPADGSAWFESGQSGGDPGAGRSTSVSTGTAERRTRATMLFVGVVVAILVLLAGGAYLLSSALGGGSSSQAAPLSVPPMPTSTNDSAGKPGTAAGAECEESESDKTTTGAGEGDTDSVPGVVLAFEHAYYVERDAEEMEPLLSKDSAIKNLDALQEGIDSVERGTTHCVHVAAADDGVAEVELTETAPDGAETVYEQHVTTTREGGEVRIVSIEDDSEGDSK